MKLALSFATVVVALLGIVTEQSFVVAAALVVVIWFLWRANKDLTLISGYLAQRKDRQIRAQRGESIINLSSSSAQSLYDGIRTIERRLADISWEMNSSRQSDFASELSSSSIEGDESSYLKAIFSMISSRFRARASAVLFYRAGNLSIHTHGVAGPRFEHELIAMFKGYLEHGEKFQFGIQFGAAAANPLSLFGIGSSLVYSVNVPEGRGIIWLGYDRGSLPSLAESKALASLAEGLHRDIIARRRIEEMTAEMRRVEHEAKAQSELIAGMSHDIRAPLHNLKNILTLFKLESASDENVTLLTSALNNCDEVVDMTEDLLLLSRYQLGRLTARTQPIDVRAEVTRVFESFKTSAELKGLELRYRADIESAVGIRADRRHLRRMLGNLVGNAIKYTQSGNVEIGLSQPSPERLLFSISDTGVGLSTSQLEQLFVPFTRFDSSSADGVGLGLAITKILAELNGGEVRAQSKLGEGSRFELSFPAIALSEVSSDYESTLSISDSIEQTRQLASRILKEPTGDPCLELQPSVLLVDDDRDGTTSLARMLERSGMRVLQASGVNEALGFIHLERPSLVVSDCSMPDGGAERLLCEIERSAPGIPVMIVSGSDEYTKQQGLLALGAVGYLTKPVSADTLITRIKALLAPQSSVIAA